jgi:polyisoprenoid-binding protein YceI
MFRLLIVFFMTFGIGSLARAESAAYIIDTEHTSLAFEVPHLVISTVEGRFKKFSGHFTWDEKTLTVEAEVETASVETGQEKRDQHLRSADFFDSKKYPKMTFRSTGSERKSSQEWRLKGLLTIRGKTLPVVFDMDYKGKAVAYERQRVAFKAQTTINRKDFGLSWNDAVEAGPVVGDQVTLKLVIQGIRKADL